MLYEALSGKLRTRWGEQLLVSIFFLAEAAVLSNRKTEYCYSSSKTEQSVPAVEQEPWDMRAADDPVAVFTFLLVVIAASQVGLFWWQLHLIRDETEDAAKAADAAVRSASATERSLNELERPHLFVSVSPQPVGAKIIGDMYLPFIDFSISNFGRTPAEIIGFYAGSCVDVSFMDVIGRGRPRPFKVGHYVVGQSQTFTGNQIELGGEVPIKYESDDSGGLDRTQPVPAVASPSSAYFRADVDYKGIGTAIFTSEFIWRWDDDAVLWALVHSDRT